LLLDRARERRIRETILFRSARNRLFSIRVTSRSRLVTRRVATHKACAVWLWDIRLALRIKAILRLPLAKMLDLQPRVRIRLPLVPIQGRIPRVPAQLQLVTLRDVVPRDPKRWQLVFQQPDRLRAPMRLPLEHKLARHLRVCNPLPLVSWQEHSHSLEMQSR
jgi:hypothetical protein